jgi:hypothetical protein
MTAPKNWKVRDQLIARFTVCVTPATYNKLTGLAQRKKLPRSELVRDILESYVADHTPPVRPPKEEHADAG